VISHCESLSYLTYQNGIVKTLSILPKWQEILKLRGVNELGLAPFSYSGPKAEFMLINENVDLKLMTEKIYKELSDTVRKLIKG
jgi:hypothetical protein